MALDESTAAIVRQDSITVIGKSYMMVYDPIDWAKQQKEWGILKPSNGLVNATNFCP
jgi:hypothetical protein